MIRVCTISVILAALLSTNALAEATGSLGAVVVSAAGYEQEILDAPATIESISKEEIENRAYKSIVDVLDDVAGISIEGGGGRRADSSSISIRGMSEEYTLFMVDGKPQGSSQSYYNGWGGGAESSWLPPAGAIERIEVIKGPMSSLYGSEAVGGVVNVITKKIPSKASGSVALDYIMQENSKSGDTKQVKYYLSSPIVADRLGFAFYGSYFGRDEDKFLNGFRYKNRKDNSLKLNYKLSDQQNLELLLGYAQTNNTGTAGNTGAASMNNDRRNYTLTHDISWLNDIKTTSYVSHENVHIENGNNRSAYERSAFNTKSVIPLESNILTFGADYKSEETRHAANRFHGRMASPNLERWQGALFIENEFIATDRLFITTGLRWDKNEHYGNELIPRIYGVYKLSNELSLKAGIGKGYKAPTLKQADPNIGEQSGGNGRNIDIGNYDLNPETSVNYELGFAYGDSLWSGEVMIFYTDFKDRIGREAICTTGCVYNGKPFRAIYEYKNVSEAEIKGAELSIKRNFGALRVKANYTYLRSENKSGADKGRPFYNTPRHMANLGIDADATKNLNLWGKVKYKSKTEETISRGAAQRTPAYAIVDVGVKYKINDSLGLFGGIYNLLDKDVSVEDGYGKHLDGRRYNLGITASF